VLAGTLLLAPALRAQLPAAAVDLSAGLRGGAHRLALGSWRPLLSLRGRVRAGLGARLTFYGGESAGYKNRGTAQGNLTPSFSIDPAVYSLNLAVFGEVLALPGVALGANLDLVGLGAGPTRRSGDLVAKPERGAVFKYGNADRGALNSEFYVAWRVGRWTQLRAGLSHYVTNYTVTDTGAAGSPGSRYQRFETVPFVALALRR
jgi:hypothetical protein